MRCWNCKQEMPEGIKYCGNCGVHLNHTVHVFRKLCSGKNLLLLLCVAAVLAAGFLFWKLWTPVGYDENMGGYILDAGDIVFYDEEEDFGYVSNMLLVYFRKDATDRQIDEVVQWLDGEVVGILPGLRQYQIQISSRSEEELEQLRKELMAMDAVKNVVIDYVSRNTVEDVSIPNDPWTDAVGSDTSWDEESPDGTNWWAEAVRLPSAWSYQDAFAQIPVGIVDTGFDGTHEDLDLVLLNPEQTNVDSHGTHVAGIIGAVGNNGRGITGVVQNGEICCADVFPSGDLTSGAQIQAGMNLCLNHGCRVVNMSLGTAYSLATANYQRMQQKARATVNNLVMMLDTYGDSFLIVQAGGNGDNRNVGVDSGRYNGHYASITREIAAAELEAMLADGVKLDNAVTVDNIMNAFIIVGAVDEERRDGMYQLAEFSNYGDAITVCAPGVRIFSTLPNGEYGYMSGTSMAAPIVTGVAAMTWSAAPELTAGEVKNLIVSTATETVLPRVSGDAGLYKMINAKAAVEKALNMETDYPSAEELFDHTYWDMYYGESLGFQFTALFYPDGSFHAYSHGSGMLEFGMYTYDEATGRLSVYLLSWGDEFTYQNGAFISRDLYEMQAGEAHRTITPSQMSREELEELFTTAPENPYPSTEDSQPWELTGTWNAYTRSDGGEDTAWYLNLGEDGHAVVAWGEPNGEFTEYMTFSWSAEAWGNGEYDLYLENHETAEGSKLVCRKLGAEIWLENEYGFGENSLAQSWYERDLAYETWRERLDYYGTAAKQVKSWYAMADTGFTGGDTMDVTLWSPQLSAEEWRRCGEDTRVIHFQAKWKNRMYEASDDLFLTDWSEKDGQTVFLGYIGGSTEYTVDENGDIFLSTGEWVEYGEFIGLQYGVSRSVKIAEDCVLLDSRNTGVPGECDRQTLLDYFAREKEYPLVYVTLTFTAREDGIYITEIEIPYFP